MDNDIIDVNYEDVNVEKSDNPREIKINADPLSTAISEVCGIANNITNAIKEYNICRQQEETKRAEIRAYLKIGLAEIEAKKECYIKQLEQHHEYQMENLKTINELALKQLDSNLEILKAATEIAKETKDFSTVIELMKINTSFIDIRSKFTLELMDKSTAPQSLNLEASTPAGYITSS